MKSFTVLCFLFLFSAFVFAARAEEENEAPNEDDVAVNDEEQQENDEEETENQEDENEEKEDEQKRSAGYGDHCTKKCFQICKPKYCTRRHCKRFQCGYRVVCQKVTRYRIIKKSIKVNVGDEYYPRYIVKYITVKVPYTEKVCTKVPKYCTRCEVQTYKCGQRCKTVCKKQCKPRDQYH